MTPFIHTRSDGLFRFPTLSLLLVYLDRTGDYKFTYLILFFVTVTVELF